MCSKKSHTWKSPIYYPRMMLFITYFCGNLLFSTEDSNNISSYVLIMISRVSKLLPLHFHSVRSNTLTIHPRFRFSDKDERFVQGVECSFDS